MNINNSSLESIPFEEDILQPFHKIFGGQLYGYPKPKTVQVTELEEFLKQHETDPFLPKKAWNLSNIELEPPPTLGKPIEDEGPGPPGLDRSPSLLPSRSASEGQSQEKSKPFHHTRSVSEGPELPEQNSERPNLPNIPSPEPIQILIKEAIEKTVNEVFTPLDPSDLKDDSGIPSFSSSLNYRRTDGGAAQDLIDLEEGYRHEDDASNQSGRKTRERLDPTHDLISMFFHPRRGVLPIYGKRIKLTGRYVKFGRSVDARVAPILEPCKVRWVSIGPSQEYYRAKAWQKTVWGQLHKHPTFALTGRPIRDDDMNKFKYQRYLLSGDYKSATDALDPRWSNFVFKTITRRVYKNATSNNSPHGSIEERINGCIAMLTNHTLHYKKGRGEEVSFYQKTGQLMGSYLSFPVLCILNAAINRIYLDPTNQTPLKSLAMLINGDDVLMASNNDFSDWADHIKYVGLRPSAEKNYIHESVCCINSQFFQRNSLFVYRGQYNHLSKKGSKKKEALQGKCMVRT
jgi:hypothetical protein